MDKNRVQAVCEVLEETVANEGHFFDPFCGRQHFRFRDMAHFQSVVQLLGLPKAKELVWSGRLMDRVHGQLWALFRN